MFLIPRFHNLSAIYAVVPGLQMYKPRNATTQCVSVHLFHVLCLGAGVFTVFKHLKLSGACDYRVFACSMGRLWPCVPCQRGICSAAMRPSIPTLASQKTGLGRPSWSSSDLFSSRGHPLAVCYWLKEIKTELDSGPACSCAGGTEPQDSSRRSTFQVQLLGTPDCPPSY